MIVVWTQTGGNWSVTVNNGLPTTGSGLGGLSAGIYFSYPVGNLAFKGGFFYVWNRVLSTAEIATLNANPFAMYGGCACTRIIRQTPRYITQQQCCDESSQ